MTLSIPLYVVTLFDGAHTSSWLATDTKEGLYATPNPDAGSNVRSPSLVYSVRRARVGEAVFADDGKGYIGVALAAVSEDGLPKTIRPDI
jgi:hypothetical protein